MAKRPDFIIAGATRSGLTTMTSILDRHAQIFIPHRKEHQFFHKDSILDSSTRSYLKAFEDAAALNRNGRLHKDRILQGETEFDHARAHRGCPDAKIIFTLQNPVERAHLQFLHAQNEKKETVRTFEHAIEAELSGLRSPQTTGRCWLFKNQYKTHVQDWLSLFPSKKVLILIYEEWNTTVHNGLKPLEDFLGLEPQSLLDDKISGYDGRKIEEALIEPKIKRHPTLSKATKEQLEEFFAEDKSYISNLLNRPIPSWDV